MLFLPSQAVAKYPHILGELDLDQQERRMRAIAGDSYQPIRIKTHMLFEYLDAVIPPEIVDLLSWLLPSLIKGSHTGGIASGQCPFQATLQEDSKWLWSRMQLFRAMIPT